MDGLVRLLGTLATTDLIRPRTRSTQHSLSQVWPDHEFKYPKVLISLALDEDQWLSTGAWADWLSSVPAVAKSAQVEGIYKSDSSLVLLSLSVAVWDMLPEDPAVRFLGFVRSNNLMKETVSSASSMMELLEEHSRESSIPESPEHGSLDPYSIVGEDPFMGSSANQEDVPPLVQQPSHPFDSKTAISKSSQKSQFPLAPTKRSNLRFWNCSQCSHVNNVMYCPELCANCGHKKCPRCTEYSN